MAEGLAPLRVRLRLLWLGLSHQGTTALALFLITGVGLWLQSLGSTNFHLSMVGRWLHLSSAGLMGAAWILVFWGMRKRFLHALYRVLRETKTPVRRSQE